MANLQEPFLPQYGYDPHTLNGYQNRPYQNVNPSYTSYTPNTSSTTVNKYMRTLTGKSLPGKDLTGKLLTGKTIFHNTEDAKVAITNRVPFVELIVHTISLTGVFILVGMNFSKTVWRDYNIDKNSMLESYVKAFQLVAKIHELFMISSLSFIAYYFMRVLMVGMDGISFGLMNATYQSGALNMLTTTGFWAGFSSHWPFALLLVTVCLFSSILGPATAIAMVPSLSWVDLKNAFPGDQSNVYYIQPKEALWPTKFAVSSFFNASFSQICHPSNFTKGESLVFPGCPLAGTMDTLSWWGGYYMTKSIDGPVYNNILGKSKRQMAIDLLCDNDQCDKSKSAYATITSLISADTLSSFENHARYFGGSSLRGLEEVRISISQETTTYQPAVHVSCSSDTWGGNGDRRDVSFPNIQNAWSRSKGHGNTPFTLSGNSDIFQDLPVLQPRFRWVKDTRVNSSSSLLALAMLPSIGGNASVAKYQASTYVACTIDARWFASAVSLRTRDLNKASSNVTDRLIRELKSGQVKEMAFYGASERPLDIQLEWAKYLSEWSYGNETTMGVQSGSPTVAMLFEMMTEEEGLFEFFPPGQTNKTISSAVDWSRRTNEGVASLLSVIVADGISRMNADPEAMIIQVNEDTVAPLAGSLHTEVYVPGIAAEAANYTVKLEFDRYAYAFSMQGKTGRFAIVALLMYATIVFAYLTYICFSFYSRTYCGGDCWEVVGELVALAMNSSPTSKLFGTGAGVKTKAVWRHPVKVRAMDGDRLELCFLERNEVIGAILGKEKKYN